jgi:uncharacterized protein (TIGR03083 family)
MTPPYAELTAAVRREGEAIVAAGRLGTDVAVPTAGDWTLADLLRHVGTIYARVARILTERLTESPGADPQPAADLDPVNWVRDELDELVEALSSTDPDTPVWNWSTQPDVAAFWARRMTHESTIHRWDAQRAHELTQPIETDLAHDGLDELVDVILPRIAVRDRVELPAATYLFTATDEGTSWPVRLGEDGVQRLEVAKDPDVRVRGTSSGLLLAMYNRIPWTWTSLEVEGDAALLDAWSKSLRF